MASAGKSLKPATERFERNDPTRSYTMPAKYYYDSEIFEQEKHAIFHRGWSYAGHVSQLAEPGSYITTRIHDQNIFVMRGKDGYLRAFYNVCQHRGHELLEGSGQVKAIVCPYHGWSYEINGSLRHARNTEEMQGFDPCDFALKPLSAEQFLGFIFVNCDPDAKSLVSQTGELEQEIRRFVPRVDELVFSCRYEYQVASNWKVLLDNFLECYHCHVAHKAFVDMVDMASYRSRLCGIYSSHIADKPPSAASAAYRISTDTDFSVAAWYLWPNLCVVAMPGSHNISVMQVNPIGPETTIEYVDWFLLDEEPNQETLDAMAYMDEVLQPEDISLCESVQRGLHSFGYNQGRFIVDSDRTELSEHAVHHFQAMVLDALE